MLSSEKNKIYELLAVFLLSVSSLAYEVLLTRIFSITQWNHLSFMVISIALFGFGLSGSLLCIFQIRKKDWIKSFSLNQVINILTALYSAFAIASFVLLNSLPLDYFQLPFEAIQIVYLLAAYLLLALPFFFTGLVISLCYTYIPEKTGLIYFASMSGSAFGAFAPVFLLPLLGEERLITLVAVIPLFMILLKNPFKVIRRIYVKRTENKKPTFVIVWGIMLVALFLVSPIGYFFIELKPSPYKSLTQNLRLPNTQIVETHTSLKGKIDTLESSYIRFAPGMSLKFAYMLPKQTGLFTDSDKAFVLYDQLTTAGDLFAKSTLTYSAYLLLPHPGNILIIQNGGGLGVLCALSSGSQRITIIEQDPNIAGVVRKHYHLPVINQNPRSFLAQTDSRYGIIHIENWGTSIPAANALNQDHFFTVEAFIQYFNHLVPGGVLVLSRKLLLPPSDSIRLWATAYESLRLIGIKCPEKHLIMLRNWDTFVLIASIRPLQNFSPIQAFADRNNFDFVYRDGLSPESVNRFNIFKSPYHYIAIKSLEQSYKTGNEKNFFSSYPLDVAPQTDNRPFPSRFLKWFKLREIYESTGSRIYSLLMSGEIVVLVVFIEAIAISILLLIIPLLFAVKKGAAFLRSQVLYFLSIGMGFMFLEIHYINQFVLLFGSPVMSFTIVLTGVMVFSGIGGILSQYFDQRQLKFILMIIFVFLMISFFYLSLIIKKCLSFSISMQYILAFLLLLPPGFLMGLPFPIGMKRLLKNPEQRAYAWVANGCASVLTSIIAAQIALSLGISFIMLLAACSYFLAFLSVKSGQNAD